MCGAIRISVNGNNDEYFRHNPDLLRRGRAIDVLDVENNARVCLVDGDAAKTLFFGEDPVGQTFISTDLSIPSSA